MEPGDSTRLCTIVVYASMLATTFFTLSDARPFAQLLIFRGPKIPGSSVSTMMKNLKVSNHAKIDPLLDIHSYAELYSHVSSSSALPPFESLAPLPLPENTPPFCLYPPLTPQSPSTAIPSPKSYSPPVPPPPEAPTCPIGSPPLSPLPSPPSFTFSPPMSSPLPKYVPSPPNSIPNPPHYGPTPPKHALSPPNQFPSPPVYLPPVVYPPSSVPPPSHKQPKNAVWCVAKPAVPDPIVQEAMDYACGSGADCKSIQPKGPCFQPNTLFAHASYAFNSYWQSTKVAGGTCDFGGIAMLVTVDPSFDNCNFIYT